MRGLFDAAVCALAGLVLSGHATHAQDSGRLLATSGVTQLEGAGGGGLVPWALITGYGTNDSFGANTHYTVVGLPSYVLQSAGSAVGVFDRLELSYAHQWFNTEGTGAKLGLGSGYQFDMDVVGAKVRLFGDAVYDQDSPVPQVAVGSQFKAANSRDVLRAIGGRSPDGVDFYIAATKLFLAQSLLLDTTIEATKANQFGLLGFGGDRNDSYTLQYEGSAALLLARDIAVGAEVRTKPDNLSFAKEGPAFDAFAAYFLNKHLSATLAFVALGPIARQNAQNGVYFSLQGGF
jgi:hypothetical protein